MKVSVEECERGGEGGPGGPGHRLLPHVAPHRPAAGLVRVLSIQTVTTKPHHPDTTISLTADKEFYSPPDLLHEAARLAVFVTVPGCEDQLRTAHLVQDLR